MSGIAGIVRLDGAPNRPEDIGRMVARMDRRGPDRRGTWNDSVAALGQTLLATTPEAEAERQPWVHADSGCVIVSDSRLDNRAELLSLLGLTHAPVDEIGDGELLHAAYQRWGAGCPDRLLGDFAFAIWDPRARRLFCARDVMGVRPFYYYLRPRQIFAFGSDSQAILGLPEVPVVLDEARIADAIVGQLEGIDKISTFYRDLFRLPPAHSIVLTGDRIELSEYWHPMADRPAGLPTTTEDWVDGVRAHLEQAVRCRLRSTRRVGSMLSGGVDSSAVVALAADELSRRGREQLRTFSVIDSGERCAETSAIRQVIASIDIDASTCDLQTVEAIEPELRRDGDLMSEPFDASMALNNCVYRLAAASSIVCVMDGMPGDILYSTSGNVHSLSRKHQWREAFRAATELHQTDRNRWPMLRALGSVAGAWLPEVLMRSRRRQTYSREYNQELLPGSLIAPPVARRVRLKERYLAMREDEARHAKPDPSHSAMSCMTAPHVAVATERYGRVAALHGIEPRHPFLDRRLIEFHAWLPMGLRRKDGVEKWALRKAISNVLPPEVAWRPRTGHLGPRLAMRMSARTLAEFESQLSSDAGIAGRLDRDKVRSALARWRENHESDALMSLRRAVFTGRWFAKQSVPFSERLTPS